MKDKEKQLVNEIKQDFKMHEEKHKQIEEMARDINNTWFVKSNGDICGTNVKLKKNDIKTIAYQLVLEGYRKLPEDSVVLSREEFWALSNKFSKKELDEIVEFHKNKTRKETAKEIFNDLLKEFSIRKSCGNADVVVREMASRKGVEV